MRQPPEIIETTADQVACDGGGGALGHPRVFLTLGADGSVQCPYCDRLYVKSGSVAAAAVAADQTAGS